MLHRPGQAPGAVLREQLPDFSPGDRQGKEGGVSINTKYSPSGHVDLRRLRRCARRLIRAYNEQGSGAPGKWMIKATRRFSK